jgi:predicted metal-binding membrane protein
VESATLTAPPSLSRTTRRGLVAGLLVTAAVAWVISDERMQGMDAGPGTDLGDLGWFAGIWAVMMAAMMLPALVPAALAHARVRRAEAPATSVAAGTALFAAGYLLAWLGAGLVAYLVIEGVRGLELGVLAWDEGGRYVAAAFIAGAAVYQFTPLKQACLHHCRDPLAFAGEHWRSGPGGSVLMGLHHGGWCIGCSAALMAALFALGVMSIGWMALVAALIAAERVLTRPALATAAAAAVLAVIGIAIAVAPDDVPGLTVPGSPEAHEAMEAMGMEAEESGMGMEAQQPGMGMETEDGRH